MTFDLQKIFQRKEARHRDLASRPIAEKLRMLDAMRERELAIRGAQPPSVVRKEPDPPRPFSP